MQRLSYVFIPKEEDRRYLNIHCTVQREDNRLGEQDSARDVMTIVVI